MINWRDGKAGFVGGLKRIIKGVFDPVYSVTSATAIDPELSMSTRNRINMPPDDRSLTMAHDDRSIQIPPNRRTTRL